MCQCVIDLSALIPKQRNQVYFVHFTAAWAQPWLLARMRSRAGSESLHLSDKPERSEKEFAVLGEDIQGSSNKI